MQFTCPGCDSAFQVAGVQEGKKVRCPNCGRGVTLYRVCKTEAAPPAPWPPPISPPVPPTLTMLPAESIPDTPVYLPPEDPPKPKPPMGSRPILRKQWIIACCVLGGVFLFVLIALIIGLNNRAGSVGDDFGLPGAVSARDILNRFTATATRPQATTANESRLSELFNLPRGTQMDR